jgi:hypothetical protein
VLYVVKLNAPWITEQKVSVKVTAMQPLAAVLADACAKFKPPLDPSSLQLSLAKKAVRGSAQLGTFSLEAVGGMAGCQ